LKQKKLIFSLLFVIIVCCFMVHTTPTEAQMREEYPQRFRLYGLIELSYRNFEIKIKSSGPSRTMGNQTLRQFYQLGMEGFIYHPRLAVFDATIGYNKTKWVPDQGNYDVESKNIQYDIKTTLLPYRPIALDLFARKIDYTNDWTQPDIFVDTSSLLYGARLRMNLKRLPSMRLEYYHKTYELIRNIKSQDIEKFKEDRYTFDIRGHLHFWNTRYQGLIDYSERSRRDWNISVLNARLSLSSALTKKIFFYNAFSYSKSDSSKMFSFASSLYFLPTERFNHQYGYQLFDAENKFEGSPDQGIEGKTTKTTTDSVYGAWGYRFTSRLTSSAALRFTKNQENETKWDTEGLSFSISYGRPISRLNLASYYRLFLRRDERRGDFDEHQIELNMTTTRFGLGIVYANYSFLYLDETMKYQAIGDEYSYDASSELLQRTSKSFTHLFRTGIRGRLPGKARGRAYWNLEAEYFHSDTNGQRPARITDEFGFSEVITEDFERKIRNFTLTADLSYPFRRGITVNFKAGFITGKSDSLNRTVYYYESSLNYPISRRLSCRAFWRQIWTQYDNSPDREESDFHVTANYVMGRTFISFEGRLRRISDKGDRLDRTLYLKLRRKI